MFCQRGMTYVEMLTVLAIVVALSAFCVPAYFSSRRSAQEMSCVSQLRQIYTGLEMYSNDHDGGRYLHENVAISNEALLRPFATLPPYIGSTRLLHCPAAPTCAREARLTTYRWVAVIDPDSPYYESQVRQLDKWFQDPGKEYPIVYCLVHDEMTYYPAERGLAEDLNPPFVIRLLPDGRVRKGRFRLKRDHLIARACQ
jgi:type II secretory pathway pseudopilin PulG